MSNNIKLYIFDFDGTIADTMPHIVNCVLKIINKFNLKPLSKDDVEKYSGAVLADALKHLGATDEQLPEIKKYYADIFFDDVSDIYLYDNFADTIKSLKDKGCLLAVASNRGRNTMIPLLESLGILSYFDKIVCESDVENKKPNPDMVNLILKELDVSENDTMVLGDTGFDILMSKNANCKACYVCHDEKAKDDVLKLNPDYVIYNFSELKNNNLRHL